ncbi:AlpA family phage regulatory protein [Desulfovibrio sp. OttesenSCG-928-A18]|nr:AlpA family phage regulatory protein [Desulfovibrio sp. OttesenSCG-928-A18]
MSQKQFPIIPIYGFLRLPQVLAVIPVSKSAWWEGCRTGRYPKPIKLGPRTTVWRAEDITALINHVSSQQQEAEHE